MGRVSRLRADHSGAGNGWQHQADDGNMKKERESQTSTATPIAIRLGYVAVFSFSLFLLFYHLDNRPLWGDEAETALLARNVLHFGVPKTIDGINHITLLGHFRDENADHIWTWSPWLQEYLVAGVYAVFGVSTWASRVAFAAIGWLSVILLARVSYQIYRDHRIALASAFLLGTSEIFLLHSRQCRYYSVTVLAEILLIYGAFKILTDRKGAVWLLSSALIVQFYANFLIAVANLPLLVALSWFTRKQTRALVKVPIVFGVFILAALPWILYAHTWRQSKDLTSGNIVSMAAGDIAMRGLYYVTEWNFHFIPWVLLLLPIISLVRRSDGPQTSAALWLRPLEQSLSILLVCCFFVFLFTPTELRYLLPLLPVACLLFSAWSFRYLRWPILAVFLIALQSATNVIPIISTFGLNRQHSWRAPLFQFVEGLNQNYADRFTDVRDFFSREARPEQSVVVRDTEFPLIFYTGVKIIDARLGRPDFLPDWILPESASGTLEQRPIPIPAFVSSQYDRTFIKVHDSDRMDNVPEPDCYQYYSTPTFVDFPIYRKKLQHDH
jgi:hypothetical protein